MATTNEPGPGLGVFCVINGDENSCRPEAVRNFFQKEVGYCRIVTSSRSYDNEKTFVTMEFSSTSDAQFAIRRTGMKVNDCRISASPFRSRRLGNLLGQSPGNRFGNRGMNQPFNNQQYRNNAGNRGRGGGWFQNNQRGGHQGFYKKGKSWGEQESEKVRGMSPKEAARYIEQRIRDKEERTKQYGRQSSYSRSRSRSRTPSSRSRSPSYHKRYSSRSSSNGSRSRSRSRSPRPRRKKKSRRSRSASASSTSPDRRRHRRSPTRSNTPSDDDRRSKEHRRRRRKRRHHRHSSTESQPAAALQAEVIQELEDWARHGIDAPQVTEVVAEEVVPNEAPSFAAVHVVDEIAGDVSPALPQRPSTELNLNIPSSLSLNIQQEALQKRHDMQQEFEADVSTITSVTEMLERHDQSIAVPLRHALISVVAEVTSKYTAEFQDYMKTAIAGKAS